MKRKKSI